jgi:NTP pyrophosphatase (non-canonical NTP hydrolase)
MDLNKYQELTQTTAIYPGQGSKAGLEYSILGFVGEAGELANAYKKILRDNHGQINDDRLVGLCLELGDALWYMARIAKELGFSFNDIATMNIEKLARRATMNQLHANNR